MINIPKGTKDVIPSESYKWHFIENAARETARLYNFKEIRTPVFEHTELFLRGVGDSTDIVNKEMYTFLDKSQRSLTLKPEGTAGVVRSYIEDGLFNENKPVKMYYITPIFRYERPQAGRLREHHQFGIEAFGTQSPSMDAEVISLALDFFKKLGLTNVTVHLNNLGCLEDRKAYNTALKEYFAPHIKDMCEDCRVRYEKNTLRILDCKVDICKSYVAGAPKISDYLCDDCNAHFTQVLKILDILDIKYELDTNLVRGLDYYTRTVFEFVSPDISGTSAVIGGGGRYDNLVETLGGQPTAAVGFGTGIERIIGALEASNSTVFGKDYSPKIFIANVGDNALFYATKLVNTLRKQGISAEFDQLNRSVKAQLKFADNIKAEYSTVVGDNEIESGILGVKNMTTGEQQQIKSCDLEKFLK